MQNIRTETSTPTQVSLQSLESELASIFAGLAVLANECYGEGAGSRMLGGTAESHGCALVDAVDVGSTRIGKHLPFWFRYGFEGIVSAGFNIDRLDENDGPFERLNDLLEVVRPNGGSFEWFLAGAGASQDLTAKSQLAELVRRVEARRSLDQGEKLSLADITLLADMNDRSVRNATSAQGEARLVVGEDGYVANQEAQRWLKKRRGFIPTQFRELPKDLGTVPDALDAVELPVFIRARLTALSQPAAMEGIVRSFADDDWRPRAAAESGLTVARIEEVASFPFSVRPAECEGLARALKVDVVWFTYQVMLALFPNQVDMLLNPGAWGATARATQSEPAPQSVTITLTAPMLEHGYLDIPAEAMALFPPECFEPVDPEELKVGAAARAHKSRFVELAYGGHRDQTDLRVKSAKTISPRRRFTGWFNTELGAKVGDRILVERTGERVYTLSHIVN